jgi:hypothetical protein
VVVLRADSVTREHARAGNMRARAAALAWQHRAVTSGSCLSLNSVVDRRFRTATFAWVWVWSYSLVRAGCSDRDIIESLLASEEFAYSYAAPYPSPEWLLGQRVHGPYVLDTMSVDSFGASDEATLRSALDDFASGWQNPAVTLDELNLGPVLFELLPFADSIHRLRDVETGRVEACFVDVDEFVAISRSGSWVLDVAIGSD